MAFVPISNLPYTLSNVLTLTLNNTSGTDISNTKFVFFVQVGSHSAISVGSVTGRLSITTTLSNVQVAEILDDSKSGNTSVSTTWVRWWAQIITQSTSVTSSAQLRVTIPENIFFPTIAVTVFKDTLQATKTLTGNDSKIVLNASTLSVTATIRNNTTNDPSPVQAWAVRNGTASATGSGYSVSGSITKPTSETVTIKIVNGRGVTKEYNYTLSDVVKYKVPSISIKSLERSTTDMEKVTVKYSISLFTGSFGTTSNSATVVTQSMGTDWETVATNTNFTASSLTVSNLAGYSADSTYSFRGVLTDSLNTITSPEVTLPVALPVISFSPDSADVFGTLHVHSRNNAVNRYIDINQDASYGAVNYRDTSDDSVENYVRMYDDRIVTGGDVVASSIALIDTLFYKNGDTYHVADSTPMTAYITTTATTIRIAIPVPKSLKRISSVTVTACMGAIISPQVSTTGYLNVPSATSAGSHQTDWLNASDVTVSASITHDHLIKVTLVGTSAFYNATNNRPLIYAPAFDGLTFKFNT